jgi:hypothetical protein
VITALILMRTLSNPHRLLCLHNFAVTNDSSSLRFIDSIVYKDRVVKEEPHMTHAISCCQKDSVGSVVAMQFVDLHAHISCLA